ncbi:MAG: hypothetical protein ACJASC_003357 [Limimaricola cinnabarinus]|jgi:hypothetical protein
MPWRAEFQYCVTQEYGRWLRPVSYQNMPKALLPEDLH